MAIDDDLSALLPKPPPARPARREAAIGEALRRFDAAGEGALLPPVSAPPRPARGGWGRPQIAALASVALVLAVSVPIWLAQKDRWAGDRAQAAPVATRDSLAVDLEPERSAPEQFAEEAATPTLAEGPDRLRTADKAEQGILPMEAIAPPPSTASAIAEAPIVTAAYRARDLAQAAPAPKPAASRDESDDSIIVTGSAISRKEYEARTPTFAVIPGPRGDWTSCTVLDPREDLGACRAIADPAAKGVAGRAAARLADGLTLAWEGEPDQAMDAFDRAIGEAPDLSIAYLNRGLLHQSRGDLRRALADFNRAVARDPSSARNYYHRSLLHRARGATARADADAKKAIALDPRYQTVLPSE